MTETGVMTDPRLVAAAAFVVTYLLPYLIDLATRPDTDPRVKKVLAKVYSWALGIGAVILEATSVDEVDPSAEGWIKRAVLLLTVVFGGQGVTHLGHKMTKENALRGVAKNAGAHLLVAKPESIEEYAPGDRIPRSVRKKAEQEAFAEFQASQAAAVAEPAPVPPAPVPAPARPIPSAPPAPTVEQLADLTDRDLINEVLRQAPPMNPSDA